MINKVKSLLKKYILSEKRNSIFKHGICFVLVESLTSKKNIGQNNFLRDFCTIRIGDFGSLEIGENFFMNSYSSINCMHNIKIGSNVMFGEGVRIYDHNHSFFYADDKLIISRELLKSRNVEIGDNVWIGSNSIILSGVVIEENVIIGAGSIVTKNIKKNTIYKQSKLDSVHVKTNKI
jgi:acetyltransferase-like isoleucine patch superfamily enzyme